MMKTQSYKYLFRLDGREIVMVVHETRVGNAEDTARKIAKILAKREKAQTVSCVWMGPREAAVPEEIRKEIRKETA